MRKIFALLLLCALTAQLQAAEWLTDLPKALEKAQAENKKVLLDFTGSDWCPYCKELHAKVLTTKVFEDYADTNLVLVEVDFPRTTKQPPELKQANAALAQKYKITVYPTVIVLGPKGKQLKKVTGYSGDAPAKYLAKLGLKVK